MPQSLSNVLIHLVFSTKNREPTITPELLPDLHAYLGGTLRNHGCQPVIVGGVRDHVHGFFSLSRTMTLAQVTEKLKTGSAYWAKERGKPLAWQAGYGAFSVEVRDVEKVKAYIRDQESHHLKVTFQEEYLALLKEFGIPFDEEYLWD